MDAFSFSGRSVMIVSVGLAIVVFAVWFFAFAGSSLPGT